MINGVILQVFHWYTAADGSHWTALKARAEALREAGFTAVWLPPASKAMGGAADVGYAVYDLYDLGEFDQRGSVRTKYGTKEEYLSAVAAFRSSGLQVYADTVFNHRMAGDQLEEVVATPYPQNDRLRPLGPPRKIKAWTGFQFPGRNGKYSQFSFNATHFDAVDYDHSRPDERGVVYLLKDKAFDDQVALEKGNYAFLMGCDLDCQSEEVRAELESWGKWFLDTTGVDGFRLDAVKHIAAWFFPRWIDAMEKHAGKDLFVVGEYWQQDSTTLREYVDRMQSRLSVFDVVLHYNFFCASNAGGHYDMRRIFDGALVSERPMRAVTFVDNHDSQPLQALQSPIAGWFKPLAYGMILLREAGYPCVFDLDYSGAVYEDRDGSGNTVKVELGSHKFIIDLFLWARHTCGHGPQYDYLDHWNLIGWTRTGDDAHRRSMAVLLSDGPEGAKWMNVAKPGAIFRDITGHIPWPVTANADGWAEFRTKGGSISVWIEDDASNVWPAGFSIYED